MLKDSYLQGFLCVSMTKPLHGVTLSVYAHYLLLLALQLAHLMDNKKGKLWLVYVFNDPVQALSSVNMIVVVNAS